MSVTAEIDVQLLPPMRLLRQHDHGGVNPLENAIGLLFRNENDGYPRVAGAQKMEA